ncbi:MAG: DUF4013 domain-containing protein [Anaerolineales bacterium]|nr:DUF4013 domain-containing protein [Anaerolineales bacterium]
MDVGAAFTYFKRDEHWINKFLIGSLLIISIIGMFPVMGWFLEIIRRVSEDDNADELPDWDDIGTYALNGLKMYGISLIWSIPMLIFILPFSFLSFVPIFISPENEQLFETVIIITSMANFCMFPIIMVYSFGLQLLTYPMYGILATTGSFTEALNPANAFKIVRTNLVDYIIFILLTFGLGYLLLPAYLLCITIFPAMLYLYTIMANLAGQAYRRAQEKLESQTPAIADQSV